MSDRRRDVVGFIGLGTMGEPMALNVIRSGAALVVWNRTASKTRTLADAGAAVAADVAEVFARADTVLVMLSDHGAVDAVLRRGQPDFAELVSGHLIISMGTHPLEFSRHLDRELRRAGARYVEAPVSGQRGPAQTGDLVAMISGGDDDIAAAAPLLSAMCRQTVNCGPVPQALTIKYASNVYMGAMQVCLAEAVNYARQLGVDMDVFEQLMTAGPMSSPVMRLKLPKLIHDDFTVQAALDTYLDMAQLIEQSADQAGVAIPMMRLARALCVEAQALSRPGDEEDAISVIRALRARGTAL